MFTPSIDLFSIYFSAGNIVTLINLVGVLYITLHEDEKYDQFRKLIGFIMLSLLISA